MLSLFRLLLIPVYMTIYLNASQPRHYIIAAVILAVSCLTDLIDGKIARKFNQISNLGKMLDPLADKLTQITIAIAFFFHFHASPDPMLSGFSWIFWFFVAKEVLMVVGAIILLAKDFRPAAANWFGKVSTFYYYIVMILLLLVAPEFGLFSRWWSMPDLMIIIMVSLSVVLTLLALISYTPAAVRQLKDSGKASGDQKE